MVSGEDDTLRSTPPPPPAAWTVRTAWGTACRTGPRANPVSPTQFRTSSTAIFVRFPNVSNPRSVYSVGLGGGGAVTDRRRDPSQTTLRAAPAAATAPPSGGAPRGARW